MASRATFTVSGDIPERTSWVYKCTLVDQDGNPIPRLGLTSLTLTIYVQTAGNPIVNAVQAVNILNAGRGQVGDTDGSLAIHFFAADNVILNDALPQETHVALVQGTYNGGQDGFNREIVFKVKNMTRVS